MITARFSVLGVLIHWEFNIDTVIPSVARAVWFFWKSFYVYFLSGLSLPAHSAKVHFTNPEEKGSERNDVVFLRSHSDFSDEARIGTFCF